MHGLRERIDAVAQWYLQQNLSIIPIGDNKKPIIEWKEFQSRKLEKWAYSGCNIALLTGQFNNLVVVDCDSEDSYIGWLKTKPMTPLRVKTRSGMHFYYRHPGQRVMNDAKISDPAGFQYDVRGDGGYVLAPPSVRSGHQYSYCVCSTNIRGKFIPFSKLPVFQMQWRPERQAVSTGGFSKKVTDGISYIRHIRAVQGEAGDRETFRAACSLIDSGLGESEALLALMDWNKTNADPPWSSRELLYKVKRAKEKIGHV